MSCCSRPREANLEVVAGLNKFDRLNAEPFECDMVFARLLIRVRDRVPITHEALRTVESPRTTGLEPIRDEIATPRGARLLARLRAPAISPAHDQRAVITFVETSSKIACSNSVPTLRDTLRLSATGVNKDHAKERYRVPRITRASISPLLLADVLF